MKASDRLKIWRHTWARSMGFIWRFFRIAFREQKLVTAFAGVINRRNPKSIEIDLTYRCNLRCVNCNRSCGVAPTTDEMTVSQVKKFLDESIHKKIQWGTIRLLGGEPTLHPDLFPILDMLLDYKKHHSLGTKFELFTNGSNDFIKGILAKLPKEVVISNAHKDSPQYDGYAYYYDRGGVHRVNFHGAPRDHLWATGFDYSNGCWLPATWGIGLSAYGYYCCSTACAIDRIFGWDLGRKEMPEEEDLLLEQRRIFCGLCGHFSEDMCPEFISEIKPSRSWKRALARYFKTPPPLSRF